MLPDGWQRSLSALTLQLAPTAGAVVRNDLPEHFGQTRRVDGFAFAHGHGAGRLVLMAGGDDSRWVGGHSAVIEEDIEVVLGREQGADVALQYEVGTVGALDGFRDLWVGGVDQISNLAADHLLPTGQVLDIGINAWVTDVCHRGFTITTDAAGAPGFATRLDSGSHVGRAFAVCTIACQQKVRRSTGEGC